MDHGPSSEEQRILDALLEQFCFDFVPVRLSHTMLSKSIMDARAPLRVFLSRSGIVDFGMIKQGVAHKLQIPLPFVTDQGAELRAVSFYRPDTKEGDPRVWIMRLASVAKVGDLLVFVFSGSTVVAVLLRGSAASLTKHLTPFLAPRLEERGHLELTARHLAGLLEPLGRRWIRTKRAGPTGVGFTLESILGIPANSKQVADVEGVELKAYRRGALTGPGKLVTLFSKTPQWLGTGRGAGLLRDYGYIDKKLGRRALYCTITSRTNSLGWHLDVLPEAGRVAVTNRKDRVLAYSFATLEKRLNEKHPATLFVKASTRGSGVTEEFRYDEVVLCRAPSFSNFIDLIDEDAVGLDFTLHLKPDGRARDHGYLWRIREARIPHLYAYRKVLSKIA